MYRPCFFLFFLFGLLAQPALALKLDLQGEPIQGGLLWGQTDPGAQISQDGRTIRVSDDGLFLIGFGRDHGPKSTIEATSASGEAERRELQVRQRTYEIQRIDGLDESKVSGFSAETLKRIRDEAAQTRRARARDDARPDWRDGFIWPAVGRITGVYGSQRILNGKPRRPHFGIDIAGPVGAPVIAPADGLVTLAHPDLYFAGGTLILDHGHGLSSSFLHLSKLRAQVGDYVRKGEVIADIGTTGRVTGPHLDWRMNLGPHRIDPERLAGPMPSILPLPFDADRDRTGWRGRGYDPIGNLPRTPHVAPPAAPGVQRPDDDA